jgi:hypothetical protein
MLPNLTHIFSYWSIPLKIEKEEIVAEKSLLFQPVEITAADDMPVQIPYQPQKAPVIPVTLGERRKTIFVFAFFTGIVSRDEHSFW